MNEVFNLSREDPHLLRTVFLQLASQDSSLKEEAACSTLFDLSLIQDSSSFRSLRRARLLSEILIDTKGDLDKEALGQILLEKQNHPFYPNADEDFYEHSIRFLQQLGNKELGLALKKFHTPLCHSWAEKLVRSTLGLPSTVSLTEVEVRRAVLCACLTPLRQNVGSCFATAPAILIQKDHPLLLLQDLYQLLSTGKLKRTFGGIEYAIPLSPSTGVGDLRKDLLKSPQATLCPGLIAADQVFGLPSQSAGLNLKTAVEDGVNLISSTAVSRLNRILQEESLGKKTLTVEEFIHGLCLKKESLTEKDLEKESDWEKSQVHQFRAGSRGFSSSSSEKIRKIQHFKQKRAEAMEAFKGICDPALLKAWEFTLASFSEVKMEFSKWNFYISLGFTPQEEGGIGELLFRQINEKIEEINKQLFKYQTDYEIAFDQLRSVEMLLRNASSEGDARRLKAEYQSRAYHLRACQELRDTLYEKGSHYSGLFSFLLKQYDQKFPEYFQEIYDAQMQDVAEGVYEDSPAGFRLMYKHGRIDPSSWTLIENKEQYIQFLTEFFSITQTPISAECGWDAGAQEIRDLTSQILFHIRTPYFLESALHRMAKAHQTQISNTPLFSLHQIEKKPWAYTSGGTMTTLLKTYYCRESELTFESKWVESPQELLIFIVDTLKNLPPRVLSPFLKKERTGMLINSPTHAFVLLPDRMRDGWQSDGFTYTWVRDEIVIPGQRFYEKILLNVESQGFLFYQFCDFYSLSLGHSPFIENKPISVIEWRKTLLSHPGLTDRIDAFLYQNLPLVQGKKCRELALEFLEKLGCSQDPALLKKLTEKPLSYLTALQFHDLVKSCYLMHKNGLYLSFDLHERVAQIARELGTAPPTSLLFADTNWRGNYFAFVVNPGTGQLDLWRMNHSLTKGQPMSQWKQWLNGQQKLPWTLFTQPYEYF